MTNFKKLLRLNRLVPFEELSQEHQEILKDSNLKEEYDKTKFWTLPSEWKIKVTKEAVDDLSKWRDAGYVGSGINGYCLKKEGFNLGYWVDEIQGSSYNLPEITLEQFKKYVICKQT